ncbi:TadE/TadG family type IV pilus assembly protein [Sphingomonas sp. Mn802worker]|uniref:TadE/TadG family type IV pilus assembly protein n=1 Tax=Sphingomonas sp. Mn802worker TaxID=629773 RepID=UPI00138AE3FB|nr:TadE/TadG family type IV pilus assembly protein [Sphingomonas sp. Mn802worker]
MHRLTRLRLALRERRAVAMVEFALVLPVILLLYVSSVELTNAMACQRKIGAATRFVADLVSQTIATDPGELDNILQSSKLIVSPYRADALSMTVTAIQFSENGSAAVVWSKAINAQSRASGSPITVPADLAEKGRFLIYADASYVLRPATPFGLSMPITLSDRIYMSPRVSKVIACQGCP